MCLDVVFLARGFWENKPTALWWGNLVRLQQTTSSLSSYLLITVGQYTIAQVEVVSSKYSRKRVHLDM